MRAIRDAQTVTSRTRAPLGSILLLSERMRLTEQIARSFASEDPTTPLMVNPTKMATELGPWTQEECSSVFPSSGETLEDVWHKIELAYQAQSRPVGGEFVSSILEIKRNTYDKWLERARHKVVRLLGSEKAHDLFSSWPEQLFGSIEVEPDA